MSICLVAIVRNEAERLPALLRSAQPLVDKALIVDTGSEDDTVLVARDHRCTVVSVDWVDFGWNRTRALELARGYADWLLMLDADMTVESHGGFKSWLEGDPDPHVAAWQVEVREDWGWYRLPLLLRGSETWQFVGRTHEALVLDERKARPVLGLTVHHRPVHGPEKHERDLELLADGFEAGDSRAVFYTAQALRALGRHDEAAAAYMRRARMNGWEEEAWYAEYQAALLTGDVEGLLRAHARRPWRAEPLAAAARLLASRGAGDDMLFIEEGK